MITILSRQEIFKESEIADREIAGRQRFYFKQLGDEERSVIEELKPRYDHLETCAQEIAEANALMILAYDESLSKQDYEMGFLNIDEILLIQDLCNDWKEFGFNTKKGKETFFSITKKSLSNEGLKLDVYGIKDILPLLFHSNPDKGDFSIYTLNSNIPLCMLFWEGNFHITFFEKDRSALQKAAEKSELKLYSRDEFIEYYYGKRVE